MEEGEIMDANGSTTELKRSISEANQPRKAPRLRTWTSKWDVELRADTWSLDSQKKQVLQSVKQICDATAKITKELSQFETKLKRPYFHEKILNNDQLHAWWRYLDFEDARVPVSSQRRRKLYDRCMVATNNYLEFWLRYAAMLEASDDVNGACSLLENACLSGRLRGRPDALMAWAELEETCGNIHRSRRIFEGALTLSGNAPLAKDGNGKPCFGGSVIEVVLRMSSFEVRQGSTRAALALLCRHVETTNDLTTKALLTRHCAKLCEDVLLDFAGAQACFDRAWEIGCKDVSIVTNFAAVLMRRAMEDSEGNEKRELALSTASSLFEDALVFAQTSNAAQETLSLWTRYIDFLLCYGASLAQLSDVQARARASESLRCFGATTDIRPKPHSQSVPKVSEYEMCYQAVLE